MSRVENSHILVQHVSTPELCVPVFMNYFMCFAGLHICVELLKTRHQYVKCVCLISDVLTSVNVNISMWCV